MAAGLPAKVSELVARILENVGIEMHSHDDLSTSNGERGQWPKSWLTLCCLEGTMVLPIQGPFLVFVKSGIQAHSDVPDARFSPEVCALHILNVAITQKPF